MKKILLFFGLIFAANVAEAKMSIFACEPEWGSLAREIVKDKMDINVASTIDQNPRNVVVKSTLVSLAGGAEMIFCSGGDLESKWLKSMINRSNNLAAVSNKNTLLLASDYVPKPKLAVENTYLQNGVRVHLNPHNIMKIAAEFTRRIKVIDPIHANIYQKNYEDFTKRWTESIKGWEKKGAILKGMPLVANDNSWTYLADWLGLKITTIVDPKTGAAPNLVGLHAIAEKLVASPAEAIIFARWEDKRQILKLQEITKIRVVAVPFTTRGPVTLSMLFDSILNSLLTDCSSGVCKSLVKPEKVSVKLL